MPDWTKKNFDELRDVSPRDVRVQWRFARQALRSPELGVSRFTYEPGARMPWGHRHRVQEEAYIVVAGSGRAKLDDEVVELSAWAVLRVAPAVIRSFEARAVRGFRELTAELLVAAHAPVRRALRQRPLVDPLVVVPLSGFVHSESEQRGDRACAEC